MELPSGVNLFLRAPRLVLLHFFAFAVYFSYLFLVAAIEFCGIVLLLLSSRFLRMRRKK